MSQFKDLILEHDNLYLFELNQGKAMFRLLPYAEYKVIKYVLISYPHMQWDIEDQVWDKCVIEHSFGLNRDHLPAGIITVVANSVLWLSCAKKPEHANAALNVARSHMADAIQQAILFICEAFPSYLPENLENKPWSTLVTRLAQAEVILGKTFEFANPDSQPIDDSGKIFSKLSEMSEDMSLDNIVNAPSVDFSSVNASLMKEEYGNPQGDYNLRNIRG